MKERLISLFK